MSEEASPASPDVLARAMVPFSSLLFFRFVATSRTCLRFFLSPTSVTTPACLFPTLQRDPAGSREGEGEGHGGWHETHGRRRELVIGLCVPMRITVVVQREGSLARQCQVLVSLLAFARSFMSVHPHGPSLIARCAVPGGFCSCLCFVRWSPVACSVCCTANCAKAKWLWC